ncbi:hypothetical protein [Streptococcus sp. DD13]|uniref:hypothetical protein n=1 Tax=Streptococcus sp. DD13 TaxID=1777881 RepID=UPI000796F4E0|nr:hypothetical protein [Streptococcus sp. DD13]KXT78342.1 hypothetical protein STRDD13_00816 [Streptococcus sp. DD13]
MNQKITIRPFHQLGTNGKRLVLEGLGISLLGIVLMVTGTWLPILVIRMNLIALFLLPFMMCSYASFIDGLRQKIY